MLVLARTIGEQIVVDGPCTLTLLRINGNQVRIGVSAEPEVRILRAELLARERQDEGERAAS